MHFVPISPYSPEDALFLYDVFLAGSKQLLDDHDVDPILLTQELLQLIYRQCVYAYKCMIIRSAEGISRVEIPVGVIYVERDRYNIGSVLGGLLPHYQKGLAGYAYRFLKAFIPLCFEELGFRKLRAEIPIYHHRPERLLLKLGFRKEGLLLEEVLRQGQPEHAVRLALTRTQYLKQQNMKQLKGD